MTKPTAVGCYIFAGGFTLGVKTHFDVLAHLEADAYGVATARRNFPRLPIHVGPDNWPTRDFHGVDFVYGNPPCFSGDTKVLTEDGPRRIKDLVRNRSSAKVWSVDVDGSRMLKPIVGWHENPYRGDFFDVRLKNWTHGARYVGSRARATANHRFLTKRGWIAASELKAADEVCAGYASPNVLQLELLDGAMLGDATIKRRQAQFVVSQASPEYVGLKAVALREFVCDSGLDEPRQMTDGYRRQAMAWFYLKTDGWVKRERARWYSRDGRKRVPRDVRLTPLSLAVWYMDDGNRRARSATATGNVVLCTDGFTKTDVDFLVVRLNELGVECRRDAKTNRRGGVVVGRYYRIKTTVRGAAKLYEFVARYVPPEMRYKLPSWVSPYDATAWELGSSVTDWDQVEVTKSVRSWWSHVYCLDVADTHNFATHGGIAHNCAAWSVAGYNKDRGRDKWRTDPRVECTRRHFGLVAALEPKVWVWESVTQAYTKGHEFVRSLEKEALAQGYSVTYVLHDAQWFGLPQVRRRFFMMVHRVDLAVKAPNWKPAPSVLEALKGVPPFGPPHDQGQWFPKTHMRRVPPGTRLRSYWEEHICPPERQVLNAQGHVKGRPSFGHARARLEGPSGAVVGYCLMHPTEHRFLTIGELQVMCGFPRDWEWAPKVPVDQAREMARGVTPPVGRWIAAVAREAVERGVGVSTPTVREVDLLAPPEPGEAFCKELDPGRPLEGLQDEEEGEVRAVEQVKLSVAPGQKVTGKVRGKKINSTVVASSAPPPPEGQGSGAYIRTLLDRGHEPKAILEQVLAHFPGSKATLKDVAWNKGKLAEMKRLGLAPDASPPKGLKEKPISNTPPKPARAKPEDKAAGQEVRRPEARPEVDEARRFDQTSMRASVYGYRIHRDYAAHFFRWGFVRRQLRRGDVVLDVGCGQDTPLVRSINGMEGTAALPKAYLGVDLNKLDGVPNRNWASYRGEFDFLKRHKEITGFFDRVVCLEVIEHMGKEDGQRLLKALASKLGPDGGLYLSTPVFNGKKAQNHIHEWGVEELNKAIGKAGLSVQSRHGTFASFNDVKKVATRDEVALLTRLNEYYDSDVTATFLAPLYPDASRNNIWVLRRK